MNYYFLFYLISVLDGFKNFLFAFLAVSIVVCIFIAIFFFAPYEEDNDLLKTNGKRVKRFAIVLFSAITLQVLLPSKDDIVFIVTSAKVSSYLESDSNLRALPYETTQFLRQTLKNSSNSEDEVPTDTKNTVNKLVKMYEVMKPIIDDTTSTIKTK